MNMLRRFSSQFLGMNSTLVYDNSEAYLIDPGVFPPELQRIRKFMIDQKLIESILLLTHTHGDHISGWHAFHDLPVYAHECLKSKSEDVRNNDVRYLRGMYRKQGYENLDDLRFPDDVNLIKDGEFMEIPPYSFAFFHTPGHSTDMTAIVIPEEKMLFSGDMLIQTQTPFILHSIRQYWKSLGRLKDVVVLYDIGCLIPGHGKPAKSQEDIIRRIENEQSYVQKLAVEGMEIVHAADSEEEIKLKLNQKFPKIAALHSHQSNVQTFLREYEDIYLDDFF
ncbi:MAG: MBL fold metallo-hydrolase [Calditrichaeota bacterium]|nr:MBL fold metallo-hydrolase [Calditrichota bacterium]